MSSEVFFTVGGMPFWAILVAYIIGLFVFVENEFGIVAAIWTLLFGAGLQYLFKVDIVSEALNHPSHIVAGVVVYFLLGTGWAVWQWYRFVKGRVNEYFEIKENWLRGIGITDFNNIPDDIQEKWALYLNNDYTLRALSRTPLIGHYKADITRWISWWPISLIWWGISDLVNILKNVSLAIYNYIGAYLQAIANKLYERIKKDLPDEFNKR